MLTLHAGVLRERQKMLKCFYMFLLFSKEDDNVVQVPNTHLPPHARRYDYKRPLEYRWSTTETEAHPLIVVYADVRYEISLVSIFCRAFNFLLFGKRFENRKDLNTIDIFVHSRKRIRVRDGDRH